MNSEQKDFPFLDISDLEFSYGEVKVLHGLNIQIQEKSITCVMGRNGVGKTTLMRNLVGLEKPSAGSIHYKGKDITHSEGFSRASSGFGYVPQGRQIFPLLTVEENLSVALSAAGLDQQSIPKSVYDTFPVLYDMRRRRGGDLSGGQQQQLAIGRALTTRPKLLILDEPTEGIQPNIITMIGEVIQRLVEENEMTILLVEQYVDFVKKYADEFLVMNRGRLVTQGSVEQLDNQVINKHLSI
jgi:urea transport system ATP-binding protein